MKEIAIIIPVKQSGVKPDCFVRLLLLGRSLRQYGFENIVVSDCSNATGARLIRTVAKQIQASYVHGFQNLYTPGRVKNVGGFEALKLDGVSSLLFLDVDVMLSSGAVERLRTYVLNKVLFEWFPVAFLSSPRGTLSMGRALLKRDRLAKYAEDLYQIGYATGIHFFDASFFSKVQGYNAEYNGYGCEDLEMLHKATAQCGLRPAFPTGHEYFVDYRTVDVSAYKGFRKYFLEQKREFPLGCMPVHFHHKRKGRSRYLSARRANDSKLLENMEKFDLAMIEGENSIAPFVRVSKEG
jgi:predicted glycosyltransferase involved in capsule biosynthesis